MAINAGYDPSQWQNAMANMINAPPPQVSAPQISAPNVGYNPNQFQGNINLPNVGGGTGGLYNTGTQQITGNVTAPGAMSFGQKYNNFMGQYGQSIGQGISAAGALFNLYGGLKSLSLMGKQFKLAKKTTKIGVNNAAAAGNNALAHHTQATKNSAADAGVPHRGATYTPFEGFG